MARPICPQCGLTTVTIGTRIDGMNRIRYLGCRHCNYRVKGTEIIPASYPSSNYLRDRYGRFAKSR